MIGDTGARRHAWCALLCLAPVGPILLRLAWLQIFQHRHMATLARGEMTHEAVEIVPRGRILDREGRVLAQSMPAWSAFIDPSAVREPWRVARALSKALDLDPAEVGRKAHGKGRFVWLKRKLSYEEAQALRSLRLHCVGVVPDERRYYPNGDLARGLLGAVGTDNNGLSGLERAYERLLSGAERRVRILRDGTGRGWAAAPREEGSPPPDLVLTLDRNIQHYAHTAMIEGMERHHPEKASVIVLDPRTGDILALADYPPDPLKARCLQEAYEPGSTFKIVAMAGALEEGLAQPEETIDTEGGRWEVAPRVFVKDHEPEEVLTVGGVLERSSNIGMAKLGLRLGPDRFYRRARAFGFGSKTGLPLSGESAGLLKEPQAVTRVILANNSFGQGLAVTSVQLAAAYSAVANDGILLEPRLVLAQGDSGSPQAATVRRVASPGTVRVLAAMLERAVARGTGVPARVPGYRVAGKTGTAQKIDPATGKYSATRYIASFAGYAPASDPRFTVLVVMDGPRDQYYGSDVAAPVFAKLMRQLLALKGVPPDEVWTAGAQDVLRSRGPADDDSRRHEKAP